MPAAKYLAFVAKSVQTNARENMFTCLGLWAMTDTTQSLALEKCLKRNIRNVFVALCAGSAERRVAALYQGGSASRRELVRRVQAHRQLAPQDGPAAATGREQTAHSNVTGAATTMCPNIVVKSLDKKRKETAYALVHVLSHRFPSQFGTCFAVSACQTV